MIRRRFAPLATVAACCVLVTSLASGADQAVKAKAKEVLEKNKDAIVTIKLVSVTRYVFGGRETQKQERKMELSGTVIDPSGLTVLSHSASDPMGGFDFDFDFEGDGERMAIKPETSISDLKIVLADGTELPAEFTLKEKDLDLAFLKPKEKPATPVPHVTFRKSTEPGLLDDVISIGRYGRELNRANSVDIGDVQAVVRKPRTFFVCDAIGANLGCPVFNAAGETLGLSVMRKSPVKAKNEFAPGRPVVLPSEDLLEVIQQALAAKTEDPKAAAGAK